MNQAPLHNINLKNACWFDIQLLSLFFSTNMRKYAIVFACLNLYTDKNLGLLRQISTCK